MKSTCRTQVSDVEIWLSCSSRHHPTPRWAHALTPADHRSQGSTTDETVQTYRQWNALPRGTLCSEYVSTTSQWTHHRLPVGREQTDQDEKGRNDVECFQTRVILSRASVPPTAIMIPWWYHGDSQVQSWLKFIHSQHDTNQTLLHSNRICCMYLFNSTFPYLCYSVHLAECWSWSHWNK